MSKINGTTSVQISSITVSPMSPINGTIFYVTT